MKILVISQYFWPETFRVNDLCKELVARGNKVTVLTGRPNYPAGRLFSQYGENPDRFSDFHGATVTRLPIILRGNSKFRLLLNYISYPLLATLYIAFKYRRLEFDRILVYQLSPILLAFPAVVLKRLSKKPLVMITVDLWPDTLKNFGFKETSIAYRLLEKFTDFIYLHCDRILVQSEAFYRNILNRIPSLSKTLEVFPSWADEIFEDLECVSESTDYFNILFAGNIGDAQDIPSVLECLKLLQTNERILFHFVGDGSEYDNLKLGLEQNQLTNAICHGRYPLEEMPKFYKMADCYLVTLKSNPAFAMTIPAKIQSYMRARKPILSMLDGEANEVIRRADCGMTAAAGDYATLARNAIQLSKADQNYLDRLGLNGLNYSVENYDRSKLIDRLVKILQSG